MSSKLITVFGATGAQGSSVCRSLAANTHSSFTLRGITRNPASAASKSLTTQVPKIELVQADGWDKASMVAAFRGSWGAFVNTNSDDSVFDNPEETRTELDLGKIIIDAAVEAGVEVFVYSGFNSAKEITNNKVPAQAFDEKNAIGKYAKATGAFKAVILASPGWYFEDFLMQDLVPAFGGFPLVPSEDGAFILRVPKWGGKEDVPFISIADDYGDIVHGIFLDPQGWNGRLVQGVSNIKSFDDAVGIFQKVTGKQARFEEIPNWRDLETYGVRALETAKCMFGFCQESGGRYFGEITESGTALTLKKRAAAAKGLHVEEAKLATLEEFFTREFAAK